MSGGELGYEWDYFPLPDGEPFTDKDGKEVIGWHDRAEDQDPAALCAAFEAYEGRPLLLRPTFARTASEVECKVHGWEEGTFVRCLRPERAKNPWPMWQIEVATPEHPGGEEGG